MKLNVFLCLGCGLLGALLRPTLAPSPARADDAALQKLQERVAVLEAAQSRRTFDAPVNLPPLDSSVTWTRGQSADTPPGHTRELLSLISEVTAKQAFAWPLYIQLTTSHDRGDGVGATVRLTSTGDGWASGFHAETFHDSGKGTTIGVNVEPHKKVDNGRSIGVNIQAVDWAMAGVAPKLTTIDEAINVQSAEKARFLAGLRFDAGSRGERAIALDGDWKVGLDLGNSPLQLHHGDGIGMRFDARKQRLEFYDTKTGRTLGFLPRTAREHAL